MAKTISIIVDVAQGAKFGATLKALDLLGEGIEQLAVLTKDATVESVKLAAAYERTENSLRVFAGSTRKAGEELKAVSDLAANTPGLQLQSAEVGYQRLRAVGFEAENARRLLAGLGKEKILSGADNAAVERVIFNFGQLTAGAQKFSQEMREMLTALPGLRRTFLDAFGSLNPQTLQAVFDKDPTAFFDKLATAMEKTKGISSDTTDTLEKLQDEIIKAGREAGKPILSPLSEQAKDLTQFIKDNKAVWADWGQYVGDVIRGLPKLSGEESIFAPPKEKGWWESLRPDWLSDQAIFGAVKTGINTLMDSSSTGGIARELSGEKSAERGRAARIAEEGNSFVKAQREKSQREAALMEEVKTDIANRRFKEVLDQETHNAEALRILESYHSSRISIIENAAKIEAAQIDAGINFTLEAERNAIQRQGQSRSASLKSQLSADSAYFNEKLRINSANKLELEKIELEKGQTLGKIQTEIVLNEIKTQKELDRIDRQIIERKRAATQELKQISIQQTRQSLDTTGFNFNRSLSANGYDAAAFNKFRDELTRSYSDLTRLSSEFHRGQLLNESLTADEVLNIIKKKNVEQAGLAEDLSRKLLEISDRQYAEQSRQLENYSQKLQSSYQSQINLYSQISNLFSSQNFGKKLSEEIGLTFFRGDYDALESPIKAKIEHHTKLREQLRSIVDSGSVDTIFGTGGDPVSIEKKFQAINIAIEEQVNNLENLQAKYSKNSIEIFRYSKALSSGLASVNDFDEAQKLLLKTTQKLELTKYDSRLNFLEGEKEKARGRNANEVARFTQEIEAVTGEKALAQLRQAADSTDLYSNSLEGLKEQLKNIRNGDAGTILGLQYGAQSQILKEQVGLARENILLQERLARVGENAADRYRNAWLSATHEVRDANIKAVEDQIRAQVKLADSTKIHTEQIRANVLTFLSQQKSATDALSDGIISAYEKAANYFDKLLGKAGDIPIFGDLLKAGSRSALSNITSNLLDVFLPTNVADSYKDKTGNVVADTVSEKLNKTNSILEQIRDGKGTASTVTNIINAGRTGGVSGALQQTIQGINGGGLAFPLGSPDFNPFFQVGGATDVNGSRDFGTNFFRNTGSKHGIIPIEELLGGGAGTTTKTSLIDRIKGIFSKKDGGLLGKGGIFGAEGFGFNGGTASAIGSGVSMLGGLFGEGSRLGRVLTTTGQGAQIGGSIGGAWGALAGASLGFWYGLFTNPQRKKDEQLRSQYRDEAVAALNRLITSANGGDASAVPQGDQVINQYRAAASALKDKKTRNIALNELNPPNIIYQRYEELKKAAQIGLAAADTRSRILPEFANGNFFGTRDQNAELEKIFDMRRGYIDGGKIGVDRHLGLFADGEIIANKEHQRRIIDLVGFDVFAEAGIPNYPRSSGTSKRSTRNYDIFQDIDMPNYPRSNRKPIPKYADGYAFGNSFGNSFGSYSDSSQSAANQTIVIESLTLVVESLIGTEAATEIYVKGGLTDDGRNVIVKQVKRIGLTGEVKKSDFRF